MVVLEWVVHLIHQFIKAFVDSPFSIETESAYLYSVPGDGRGK